MSDGKGEYSPHGVLEAPALLYGVCLIDQQSPNSNSLLTPLQTSQVSGCLSSLLLYNSVATF